MLVLFGRLASIDLQVKEAIIMAPATGRFGGVAVAVAVGMGAGIIAAGRNKETSKRIEEVLPGQ